MVIFSDKPRSIQQFIHEQTMEAALSGTILYSYGNRKGGGVVKP